MDFFVAQGQQGGLRVLPCLCRHSALRNLLQCLHHGSFGQNGVAPGREEGQLVQSFRAVALVDGLYLDRRRR